MLYASLKLSFFEIKKENFFFDEVGNSIKMGVKQRKAFPKLVEIFEEFILQKGWDLAKVQVLSQLVYLNMAGLHEHPIDRLLWCQGLLGLKHLSPKIGATPQPRNPKNHSPTRRI